MVCYIYCKINNQELMVNEDDPEDIKIWYFTNGGGRKLKKPYWKQVKISPAKNKYNRVSVGNNKRLYLHRVFYYAHNQDWDINDNSTNNQIDHIDGNRKNNNITNLRVVTQQQNCWNFKTSKGYDFKIKDGKWRARIYANGKETLLGYFDTEEEARNAYLEAKKIYHNII